MGQVLANVDHYDAIAELLMLQLDKALYDNILGHLIPDSDDRDADELRLVFHYERRGGALSSARTSTSI